MKAASKVITFFGFSIFVLGAFATTSIRNVSANTEPKNEVPIYNVEKGEVLLMKKVQKTEEEWKKQLTSEQFKVMRKKGTEKPFSGDYVHNKEKGIYRCMGCGTALFDSETKFESGTGWPSFWQPIAPENVGEETDRSFFMTRTEVHCPVCGAHLGHVFDDGPKPTGKRYCINSVSLKFQKSDGGEA